MSQDIDLDKINIKKLVADTNAFREFVYTPQSTALEIISKRWKDKDLKIVVENFIAEEIPSPFAHGIKSVLFRQIFSPNYEFRHFMELSRHLGLDPVFLEYHDDIFTSSNPIKHCLGRMKFWQVDSNFRVRIWSKNIIDFNISQGKKMKEVKTLWDQSLIDFHHEILESAYPNSEKCLFDGSTWFHALGGRAMKYYTRYISLYIRNGICFENFILEGDELKFIEEIFLPCYIDAWKATGSKPIIVSLLPFDSENDCYWMSYPPETRSCIENIKVV